uniref:rRNA adenine N(6)-methyltransferase n=1 Tax=Clastoptera arizonana TaxID=38151 RepID=A0A1B6D0A2_9HEMI
MLRLCYQFDIQNTIVRFELRKLFQKSSVILKNRLTDSVLDKNIVDTENNSDIKKEFIKGSKFEIEVAEYLSSKQCLKDIKSMIPEKYTRKRYKYPDSQFVVDKDIAEELISLIKPKLLEDSTCHIFEINPGPGAITEQLLQCDIKNLRIFESDSNFISNLNVLSMLNKKTTPITQYNFLLTSALVYKDKFDNNGRFDSIMSDIQHKKWEDSPAVKIIGVIPPAFRGGTDLVRYLIYNIIFQTGLVLYGRPELFVVMQPSSYLQITSNNKDSHIVYRSSSVLFSLFFESEILRKIPKKCVFPWSFRNSSKRLSPIHKILATDKEFLYFVRVTPHADLLTKIKPELLKPLWYFLRHHMISRRNRVIETIENWIPGCGPRLIAEGITLFTEFGDLTPQEILHIFKLFASWPEFNSCPFLSSMETALLKMENPGCVDVLEDEDSEEVVEENGKTKQVKL